MHIPPIEELEKSEIDTFLEVPREEPPKLPLFNINVIVNEESLKLDASYKIVEMIIKQVFTLHMDLIIKYAYFLPDPFFKPFLQPLINGKVEDRICGYGPRVSFYIEQDKLIKSRRKDIFHLLTDNYKSGYIYIQRFKYMQKNYAEDFHKTTKEIEEERCK